MISSQQTTMRCPGHRRGSDFLTSDTAALGNPVQPASAAVKIALVVVPEFSTLDVGAVLESVEHANSILGHDALVITSYAFGTLTVKSKSRLKITCDGLVESLLGPSASNRADILILCCGSTIPQDVRPDIKRLLNAYYGRGTKIVGIGNAAWLFAEWGLLNGRSGTVHWQYLRAFSERYTDVDVKNSLYVAADKVLCCAGEAATLDLMFDVLSTHVSENVANNVLNRLLITYPRSPSTVQPGSQELRLRHQPAALQNAVRVMAGNIEIPLPITDIAAAAGVSTRQLERLFKKCLGCSPKAAYLQLQLEHAVQLVEQSEMPLTEIALACGLSNASMLSRHFKRAFGSSPSAMRARRISVTDTVRAAQER